MLKALLAQIEKVKKMFPPPQSEVGHRWARGGRRAAIGASSALLRLRAVGHLRLLDELEAGLEKIRAVGGRARKCDERLRDKLVALPRIRLQERSFLDRRVGQCGELLGAARRECRDIRLF